MSVAQHAEQILAAWKTADVVRFELELNAAMHSCQKPEPNGLEEERREVLASVVERLRLLKPQRSNAASECTPAGLHAGFTLLEHLRQRVAA
jgi:hypothetical protein